MTDNTKTAYLSLGSNRGDRVEFIANALRLLDAAGCKVVKRSGLYETAPVGTASTRWFLNCVAQVEVEMDLMPFRLLRVTQRIEQQLGRGPRSGIRPVGRTIDIDIIFYGQSRVAMPELVIPHPRLADRRFVLVPLNEVAPNLRHPLTGQTPAEMLATCRDASPVRRYQV